nr:hypothetical protein [uncultured Flavobacterium sp.]
MKIEINNIVDFIFKNEYFSNELESDKNIIINILEDQKEPRFAFLSDENLNIYLKNSTNEYLGSKNVNNKKIHFFCRGKIKIDQKLSKELTKNKEITENNNQEPIYYEDIEPIVYIYSIRNNHLIFKEVGRFFI